MENCSKAFGQGIKDTTTAHLETDKSTSWGTAAHPVSLREGHAARHSRFTQGSSQNYTGTVLELGGGQEQSPTHKATTKIQAILLQSSNCFTTA